VDIRGTDMPFTVTTIPFYRRPRPAKDPA